MCRRRRRSLYQALHSALLVTQLLLNDSNLQDPPGLLIEIRFLPFELNRFPRL